MKILGINRVELVLENPDEAAEALSELLGMHFETDITEEHGVLSRTDFRAGLELAGPSRPDSAMTPILEQRGEGLLTTVFRVDSVEAVLDMAKRNGIEVLVDLDKGRPSTKRPDLRRTYFRAMHARNSPIPGASPRTRPSNPHARHALPEAPRDVSCRQWEPHTGLRRARRSCRRVKRRGREDLR
jgi:hypothetical protein